MNLFKSKLIKVVLVCSIFGAIFLFADSTEASLVFGKPISSYSGNPIPSNFQLLRLISLVTGPNNGPSQNKKVYYTYISKGDIDTSKINAFIKNHYAHLIINTVLLENIEKNELFLPEDIVLDSETVMETRQSYSSFMEMIRQYYLNDEYYSYNKGGYSAPTFREFIPIYTKSVRVAVEIQAIEQRIFDALNEMINNVENESFVNNTIEDVLLDVDLIKTKMPYSNLPNNLLVILFIANDRINSLRKSLN